MLAQVRSLDVMCFTLTLSERNVGNRRHCMRLLVRPDADATGSAKQINECSTASTKTDGNIKS